MRIARGRQRDDVEPTALALLERRAERLRARGDDDEAAMSPAASFTVGDRTIAIPLASVRAAIPLRAVTPVPLAPPHVIGVLRFRGRIVPVTSLAAVLGVRGWRVDPAVLLVLDGKDGLVAIDCEEIPRAISLPRSAFIAARADTTALHVVDADGAPVFFLADPAALIARGPHAG